MSKVTFSVTNMEIGRIGFIPELLEFMIRANEEGLKGEKIIDIHLDQKNHRIVYTLEKPKRKKNNEHTS